MIRQHTGRSPNPDLEADVLAVALTLARVHGPAVTVDQIAEGVHVSKASIYRRWSTKWDMLLDALLFQAGAKTDGAADLRSFLTATFAELRGPVGTGGLVAALMAHAVANPGFAKIWRDQFITIRRRALRDVLVREGIRDPDGIIVDVLFGVMWYRLLVGHGELDDALADHLTGLVKAIDVVAAGIQEGRP